MLSAVYLAVSLPFKVSLVVIPGFTDVRPVVCLQPIYGVFFGVPGCIAFGLGNLVADVLGDGLRWSSVAGFVMNALGPALFCLVWSRARAGVFDLRTPRNVALFAGASLACAAVVAGGIAGAIAWFYPETDVALFFFVVVGNNTVFSILLGMPIAMLMQEEMGVAPRGLGFESGRLAPPSDALDAHSA